MDKVDGNETEAAIRRYVIAAMIKGADKNHPMLERRQKAFRVAVLLLVVEVALLLSAIGLH